MSNRDNQSFRKANAPRQTQRVYVDKAEVRTAFRGKEAFSLHDVTIHVKVPYDPEINQILKSLKAKWNSDKKFWELPVGRFAELKPHIDKINEAKQLYWHDRVNKSMREHVNDKRIFVDEQQIQDYPEGKTVFHDGKDWDVTYIGRKKVMGDTSVKYPVYLSALPTVTLKDNAEDEFR